jgi:hypothetical protein
LLTEQSGSGEPANEPHDYRTEDIGLHRYAFRPQSSQSRSAKSLKCRGNRYGLAPDPGPRNCHAARGAPRIRKHVCNGWELTFWANRQTGPIRAHTAGLGGPMRPLTPQRTHRLPASG